MRKTLLFLLLPVIAWAQDSNKAETARLNALYAKLEGTYQLQLVNMRQKVAYPLSILDEIEAKRKDHDTATYWLQDRIRVVILPRDIIAQKNFQKLTPDIINVSQ